MIETYLKPALQAAFPTKPFEFGTPPEAIAQLQSPQSEPGMLRIFDDGYEATVWLGTVTHSHFGCYDDALSEDDKHRAIANDVVEFLSALFEDRILLTSSLGGRVGGWRRLDEAEMVPASSLLKKRFLWSGPVSN